MNPSKGEIKMKKLLVFLCAGLFVLGIYSTVGAIPSDNLVTNGTFDGDGEPWEFDGDAGIFSEFGNPFAAFIADGRYIVGFVFQEVTIPDAVDTLYLSFDYGFFEEGDTDSSDDLDEDGFPVNTAALLAGVFNDIEEFFVVATESTIDPDLETYDDIFNSHFSVSFDASELAGNSAGLVIAVIADEGIFGLGAVDNVTLSTTAPVPEPATMLLLGSGLIGLAAFGRRFRKS